MDAKLTAALTDAAHRDRVIQRIADALNFGPVHSNQDRERLVSQVAYLAAHLSRDAEGRRSQTSSRSPSIPTSPR